MNFFENAVIFDKFQIIEKLGEDFVFSSYLGKNLDNGSKVFIKILNQNRYTRYEVDKICYNNELPTIKAFDHRNIMHVIEAGTYSNTVCVVSEYIGSTRLDEFLKGRGALDVPTSLNLISQLASALRYAHSKNIIHRNLKASNIGIFISDGSYQPKIFDFGLSYIIDYSSTPSELVDDNFGFMSPESTGLLDRKVDARSDLYSLGVLLYRFITGSYPFHADTIDNMVYQHVAVMPKNPSDLNPAVPEVISKLIMKLLSKDPDQRYESANELINDLDVFMASSSSSMHMRDEDLLQTMDQRSRILSRKHELAQLRNFYTKALEGPGRFCLVRGSLGSGKSDLFSNLCNELTSSKIPYFRAHFTPQTMMTPYYAFHDILETFAVRFDKYDRKLQLTERSRLARNLMGLSDLVFKICPDMKKVLPESLSLPSLEGFREQQRSVMLLSTFFLSLQSQGSPFVFILDDIHYADAASLSLLLEMANHISNYKVFVVCSCRDTDYTDSHYLSQFLALFKQEELFSEIDLEPFSESRMCEYLADLLILDKDECQILASYIAEKTSGNPYFAVNIIRSMIEDNVISVSNGVLEQNWEQMRVINQSVDVFQLIERRMSRLSPETISMLKVAAVIGNSFSLSVLQTVCKFSRDELFRNIDAATALQFIEYSSVDDVMEFSHRDVHSVLFSKFSEDELKKTHYDIAKAIESLPTERERKIYDLVTHYMAAGDDNELRKYILDAAAMARFANATSEALSYYNKALELIIAEGGSGNEDWCITSDALVDLNLLVGNFDTAIEHANNLLPHMPDDVDRAKLLHRIALSYYRLSRYDSCEEMLMKALDYLGIKFPDSLSAIKSRTKTLKLHLRILKVISDNPVLSKLNKPKDGDTRTVSSIVSIYETLCRLYAERDLDRFNYTALAMYKYSYKHRKLSSDFALALTNLAIYYIYNDNLSNAKHTLSLAGRILTENKDTHGMAHASVVSAFAEQWMSQTEPSIKLYKEAIEGYKAAGDSWEMNNINISLCETYLMAGDYSTCERLCLECIATSEHLDDTYSLIRAYSCLVSCYSESGNYANAEEVAKRCKPIADELNQPHALLVFYNAYSRLLIDSNKYSDAIVLLTKAQQAIEENNLPHTYSTTIYANLALARIHMLSRERSSMSLNEIQNAEFEISSLCTKAIETAQKRPHQQIVALRVLAQYGIATERFKKSEQAFKESAQLTPASGYHYENAKLDYEYSRYLLSKHRTNEARFYIFEAYMTFTNISSTQYIKICEKIISEKYKEDFRNNALLSDVSEHKNRMNVDRRVNTLLRLGDRLTSTLELDELQRKILQDAVELVGAERGILFLYPEAGDKKLYVASVYNLGSFDCNTYDWMLEEVETNRKPIVINDVQSDEYRKHYSVMARYGIKSVMAMPMFVRGALFGVIYLDSRLVRQIFTDDYIEAMGFIANQAGAPIENARLYHRAITDGLTGIYGRSYLDNKVIDLTSEENAKVSAIMIDVDNFKRCNDTYGHPFGDKVLKQIAGIMKRVAGDNGIPCRYGGEEFVVLLGTNDADFALDIANKIRQTVENSTLACNNGTDVALVSVTISLGVSIWSPEMERVDLIEHADKALYYAKTHGKNQAVLWNESIG